MYADYDDEPGETCELWILDRFVLLGFALSAVAVLVLVCWWRVARGEPAPLPW